MGHFGSFGSNKSDIVLLKIKKSSIRIKDNRRPSVEAQLHLHESEINGGCSAKRSVRSLVHHFIFFLNQF